MFAEGNIKGQNCPRGSVGKKLDLKGCNFKTHERLRHVHHYFAPGATDRENIGVILGGPEGAQAPSLFYINHNIAL